MADHGNAYAHTEGNLEDILFQMPVRGREMRVDDILTYTNSSNVVVVYKIESVGYHLKAFKSGSQTNSDSPVWDTPIIYYGVSVVP